MESLTVAAELPLPFHTRRVRPARRKRPPSSERHLYTLCEAIRAEQERRVWFAAVDIYILGPRRRGVGMFNGAVILEPARPVARKQDPRTITWIVWKRPPPIADPHGVGWWFLTEGDYEVKETCRGLRNATNAALRWLKKPDEWDWLEDFRARHPRLAERFLWGY